MNKSKKLRTQTTSTLLLAVFVFATISFGLGVSVQAQTESLLREFHGAGDGRYPEGSVIFDASGNLYSTTNGGGSASCGGGFACGVVFELSPVSGGAWQEAVLDSLFTQGGINPAAGLVFDGAGNLYGTTSSGGNLSGCSGAGCGVVFELSPQSDGRWRETLLHAFTGGRDGAVPLSSLIFDAAGNLYGTTSQGGVPGCGGGPGCGTVFELSPDGTGHWHETVLHAFTGGRDGAFPVSSLIFDAVGNLYGNAAAGGGSGTGCAGSGCGVIFELSPTTSGSWSGTVLHAFTGVSDGSDPQGNLVFDPAGNLYGATFFGGNGCGGGAGCGTIFELSPTSGGQWKGKELHTFSGTADGAYPSAGLVLDAAGDLYGTASRGGGVCACGVVFKLSPNSNGSWHETLLHTFAGGPGDGELPFASLIFDASGNLYGTTFSGGKSGYGTVFEITP
jgi:uncharacterized repeat protein (TIGR03803 family)